jgi:arabinofuranosyltransferase
VPSGRRGSVLVVLALAVPLAVLLTSERRIAGATGFPLDDSWIHLQFARNLAEGAGFSFNPGVPVAGSTAPLWTLLLGAAFALAGPSIVIVKAIGVAVTLAAALITRQAALAWGASGPAALAAALAVLWTGPLAWGSLSGMEVPLAAMLVAAALWAHARGRLFLTALFAALAPLARPESIVLLPLLAVSRPPTARRLGAFVGVAVLVLAPAVAFSLATVGAPVPATAAAKIEGGLLGWLAGVHEPLTRLFVTRPLQFAREWIAWLWTTHVLMPIALAPGVIVVWRRIGPALGLPALALIAHPVAMALLAPYRGPAFQEGRYSAHLLPLAFVVLAAALGPTWTRRRGVVAAVWLALALASLVPAATRYGWAVQNINAMQVRLGYWVAANVPRHGRVALNDIGAIGYISRRRVIDLMGLVTPEIIPYRREGESGVLRFVGEQCPDYVIVFPAWFPDMTARRYLLEPIFRVRLERNEVAGADEMVVYRLARCAV